jgi:hypothetical protein
MSRRRERVVHQELVDQALDWGFYADQIGPVVRARPTTAAGSPRTPRRTLRCTKCQPELSIEMWRDGPVVQLIHEEQCGGPTWAWAWTLEEST